jgi:hypothetical protein
MLAYLDRSNLANVKILQAGTPDSLETSLGLEGVEFNWVRTYALLVLLKTRLLIMLGRVRCILCRDGNAHSLHAPVKEAICQGVFPTLHGYL